ncbi:MAG: DUF3422 family protein [Alphaproteobacteria bacterium]|nr:DUF3422 family protein [Alphaproteobacteria bacterium]
MEPNVRLVRGQADTTANEHSINSTVLLQLSPESAPLSSDRPSCRARMRIDVHTEIYAITLAVDSFDLTHQHPLIDRLNRVIAGEDHLAALFDEVWAATGTPFGRTLADLENEHLFGARFADFRGVVIPATVDPDAVVLSRLRRLDDPPLQPGIAAYVEERRALLHTFLGLDDERKPPPQEHASESVLCSLLDGQALYAAPLVHWGTGVLPVRYLLAYGPDCSPDQLGRLVRRLHVMGELRHTALLDYDRGPGADDLKRASKEIREVGALFNKKIHDGEITDFSQLSEISTKLNELNRHADGGITYRTEQSRYYADAFKERLPDLRVGRIEGYQPYDAFVRRYVYQTFSKIDQVGRRYEALGRRLDRWTFLSSAENADAFQRQLKTAADEMSAVVKKIGLLQTTAERFATIFVVYYIGYILKSAAQNTPIRPFYDWIWAAAVVVVVMDVAGNESRISGWVYGRISALSTQIFKGVALVGSLVFGADRHGDRAQADKRDSGA